MRWALLSLVACGGGSSIDAGLDAPASVAGHVALRGDCEHPVAGDGGAVLPDTVVQVQTSFRAIDLVNDGTVAIDHDAPSAFAWSIEGPDAGEFAVMDDVEDVSDSHWCNYAYFGQALSIPVGATCHFGIAFAPHTVGIKTATLRVTKLSGHVTLDQTFPIHATAVAAPAGLIASHPDLYLTTMINPDTIRLVNGGTATVALGALSATGPFALSSNCPDQLTPGGACDANVAFQPPDGGCPSGTFASSTGALSVPLFARGASPQLSVGVGSVGRVTIEPGDVACDPPGCTLTVAKGQSFTLTATPAVGAHFVAWTLPDCGTATSCALTIGDTNVGVGATFASAAAKAIAVSIVGQGTVAGDQIACAHDCTMYVEPGAQVQLNASTTGAFSGWMGDCMGTNTTCNLGTVLNDRSVVATFAP